jgi:hypothetical protein
MSYDNLSSVSQNVLKFYQQLTGVGIHLLYPRNEVVGGYTGFTMSVRPSVDKSYVVR